MSALFALIHVTLCKVMAAISNNEWAGQLTLTHNPGPSQTTTDLWMLFLSAGSAQNPVDESWRQVGGARVSITGAKFEFAVQTGFTGDIGSVSVGDTIAFQGGIFSVQSIFRDATNSIYQVAETLKSARVLGVA